MVRTLLIAVVLLIVLTGCLYDSRELDHRSLIMGMAIEEGKEHLFSITIQLPVLTQGTETGTGPSAREFETFTAEADTLWDALSELESVTPSILFFGHMKTVMISEAVAKEHLPKVLDLLARESSVGSQVYLLVIEGSAKEFLQAESPLVSLPSLYVNRYFSSDQKLSRSQGVKLYEYRRDSNTISNVATLPLAKIEDNVIKIQGMAFFKNDHLVEKLQGNLVGLSELMKEDRLDFMNYTTVVEDHKVNLSRIKLTQDVDFDETNPVQFHLKIKGKGEVIAIDDINKMIDNELIDKINKKMEQEIKTDIEQLINKLQQKNIEPWLMGQRIWGLNPSYFNKLKWEEEGWKNAQFTVDVKFNITNTGQRDLFTKERKER
ncbi:Ger(x)C family spore germination protein [Halalkalibacter urbisdiaboli]|uniref:Ger(x)C family spore germination protein n=1 Tax=Halalkalibacter urbisdiaboli TaxID=1960589 RepID=UPI000B444983|nr:Ger(x)C family spore germination protein [Halalkalibacter urbisdiaboli]